MKIRFTFLFCLFSVLIQAQQTFNIPFAEHVITEWLSCDEAHNPRAFVTSIGIQNLLNDPIDLKFKTIESHLPTDWNYSCNGQWGTISNCYTNLDDTNTLPGRQRIWFDHEFQFLSPPTETDSLTAKVEVFDVNSPTFRDTMEMKIIFRVPDLEPIEMDVDTRIYRDESVFINSNVNSFEFWGEVLSPYKNKEMRWEETFSSVPTDWEYDCDGSSRGNVVSFDMCQNQSGSFILDCLEQFELGFEIDVTQIGNKKDSLEKRWIVYDPDNRAATELEFGFTLIKCPRFSQVDLINYSGPTSFCNGEIITLDVDPNLQNIDWMVDGQRIRNMSSITVPAASLITVASEDDIGCILSDSLELEVQVAYEEQICVVAADSLSGNNLIVWEKTNDQGTEYFKVYRETAIVGEFDSIGVVAFGQLSQFEDVNVNPQVSSYQYKISAVDNCDNESELSQAHQTLHLTSSQGINGEVNLIWDNYKGIPFSTVNILTGPSLDSMILLTQRTSNAFTYVDLTPQFDPVFYQIEIILNDACTASRSTDYLRVRSNPVSYGISSVGNVFFDSKVEVYPNPTSDFFFVKNEFEKALKFSITDLNGKELFEGSAKSKSTEKVSIDFPKGVYLFVGKTEIGTFAKKLIIN